MVWFKIKHQIVFSGVLLNVKILALLIAGCVLLLSACGDEGSQSAAIPTATLAAVPSQTPRFTATPQPSLTPLPTFTPTPSETPIPPTLTLSPTPSSTPQSFAVVQSLQRVNVRSGPGENFDVIEVLDAGVRVEILEVTDEGRWYRVLLEDGREGWMSGTILRIIPTPTAPPTLTPTVDQTAIALGTVFPTAILGGAPVTPTPPPQVVTANAQTGTPAGTLSTAQITGTSPAQSVLQVTINPGGNASTPSSSLGAFELTATAIVRNSDFVTPSPIPFVNTVVAQSTPTAAATNTLQAGQTPATAGPTQQPPATSATNRVYNGEDILALCNDPAQNAAPPTDIGAGSVLDIYWGWFATSEQLVSDHTNAVTYDVRLNGQTLAAWRSGAQATRQQGNLWVKYWFVPVGPLPAGQYEVTYRATWSRAISDGFANFGPGTNNPVEEGNCTFTVNP